jgi:monoamine oxidase
MPGAWAIYTDAEGRPQRADADYCVSTIPLPILSGLQKDLSDPVQSAIAAARYDGAGRDGDPYACPLTDLNGAIA